MAARANSLTEHARPAVSPAAAAPTMAALDVQVLVNGLRRLGYDVGALLAATDLTDADLTDPDRRLSCEIYGLLVCDALRQRAMPNLALKLATATPIGSYPLLDYLILTSETVGAGLRQLAQYVRLSGSPVRVNIRETDRSVRVELVNTARSTMAVEYFAALLVLHFRAETDGRFAAARVTFQHSPEDLAEYEHVFGCPVHANAAANTVDLDVAAFRLPLSRRDSVLRKVLEARADELLARLPQRAGLAAEVQRALTARVAGGDVRVEAVARELATSGRTLQRRLSAEGVSYQELLDEARKEAAARYLSESVFAIGEVAYLVGYSEPAPFYRAFKRWYGVTPESFRQARRR